MEKGREGRKARRKERKEGKKGGRKEWRKGGREERRKGRKEGRKETEWKRKRYLTLGQNIPMEPLLWPANFYEILCEFFCDNL
jgi:hypothetical protein